MSQFSANAPVAHVEAHVVRLVGSYACNPYHLWQYRNEPMFSRHMGSSCIHSNLFDDEQTYPIHVLFCYLIDQITSHTILCSWIPDEPEWTLQFSVPRCGENHHCLCDCLSASQAARRPCCLSNSKAGTPTSSKMNAPDRSVALSLSYFL